MLRAVIPTRDPSRLVLALAVAICGLIGLLAGRVPAAGNDLLLHGHAIEAATEALRHGGWAAFQDPWVTDHAGGYALFRHYPSLAHRFVAVFGLVLGPWAAMQLWLGLGIALLPVAAFVGARWLGQSREQAAVAALVLATMRCGDGFGHAPLNYSITGGYGIWGQLAGALALTLTVPAVYAVAKGAGLSRWSGAQRLALAALLASLVVRTHLPSAAVLFVVGLGALTLGRAGWGRLVAAGVGAAALSAVFLGEFLPGLALTGDETLAGSLKNESYGLGPVLSGLVSGRWIDWGTGIWSALAVLAAALGLRQGGRGRWLGAMWWGFVLLFAGRATWGDWVDGVPLFGRFHDQRWQLGFQVLTPWLVAELVPWRPGQRVFGPRLPPGLGRGLVLVAAAVGVLAQGSGLVRDARGVAAEQARWAQLASALEPQLRALPPAAVLAAGGPGPGGLDAVDAASRLGITTVADPRQHYGPLGESMPLWEAWVDGRLEGRPPPGPADLRSVGASHALLWTPSGPTIQALPPSPGSAPGARLVRSDLALERAGPALDGATLAWLHMGLGAGRQHPRLVAAGEDLDAPRRGRLADQDPGLFAGLSAGDLAGSLAVTPRPDGGAAVALDGAEGWLMVARAWHPGWAVTVDGAPREHRFLFPGYVGVEVAAGDAEVVVAWPARSGLGVRALLALLVWLAGFAWLIRGLRAGAARPSPAP